jgi:hypothetical protein
VPTPCSEGRTCFAVAGGGVCLRDCGGDAGACPDGTECRDLGGTLVCLAVTYGPRTFGEICDERQPATLGCERGDLCLRASAEADWGYCTLDCSGGATCPEASGIAAACIQLSPWLSLCMFPCGQPGQLCPPDLTCTMAGSGELYCLAP